MIYLYYGTIPATPLSRTYCSFIPDALQPTYIYFTIVLVLCDTQDPVTVDHWEDFLDAYIQRTLSAFDQASEYFGAKKTVRKLTRVHEINVYYLLLILCGNRNNNLKVEREMFLLNLGATLIFVLMTFGAITFLCEDSNPTAETSLGQIRGSYLTSASGRKFAAFRGIPYAQPPLGSLRFKVYGVINKFF